MMRKECQRLTQEITDIKKEKESEKGVTEVLTLISTHQSMLQQYNLELSSLYAYMEKNQLTEEELHLLSTDLLSVEKQQFATDDLIKSKRHKLAEVVQSIQAYPQHELLFQNFQKVKQLRQ